MEYETNPFCREYFLSARKRQSAQLSDSDKLCERKGWSNEDLNVRSTSARAKNTALGNDTASRSKPPNASDSPILDIL